VVPTDDIGVSRSTLSRAVARGELVRLTRSAFAIPGADDGLTPLAAALITYPAAVASHRAAAWLWQLVGIEAPVPDITVPRGRRPTIGVPHQAGDLEPFEVRLVDNLRVTDPTRTLCDLGAVCDGEVVERAVESALRKGLTSLRRLEWRCAQLTRRGRAGPGALRAVLDARGTAAATESLLETRYLQVLRDHGVPLPVRQHAVFHRGRFVARVDNAYPEVKVFVELDGWAFHGSRGAFQRDRERQNDLVLAGWSPLRFTWGDVHDRPGETAERTLGAPQPCRSAGSSWSVMRRSNRAGSPATYDRQRGSPST
jgi:very-short-patch-repair endonuclease